MIYGKGRVGKGNGLVKAQNEHDVVAVAYPKILVHSIEHQPVSSFLVGATKDVTQILLLMSGWRQNSAKGLQRDVDPLISPSAQVWWS